MKIWNWMRVFSNMKKIKMEILKLKSMSKNE